MSGGTKPTFVVRDIEPYMEERDQRAADILNQVLLTHTHTHRHTEGKTTNTNTETAPDECSSGPVYYN